MCPKPKAPEPPKDKPVQYLRNPYLDGLTVGTRARGRNSLRTDSPAQPVRTSGLAVPFSDQRTAYTAPFMNLVAR